MWSAELGSQRRPGKKEATWFGTCQNKYICLSPTKIQIKYHVKNDWTKTHLKTSQVIRILFQGLRGPFQSCCSWFAFAASILIEILSLLCIDTQEVLLMRAQISQFITEILKQYSVKTLSLQNIT
jgi:hypothetical protein